MDTPTEHTPTTAGKRRKEHHALLFAARRGVRYHLLRERFLMRCHYVTAFLTAVAGTSAFVALSGPGDSNEWTRALVGAAAVFGALDLVLGFSRSAHRHAGFARECAELERAALRVGPDPSPSELDRLVDQRLELETREPVVHRVLDTLCHNELVIAHDHPDQHYVPVTWYQRFFAQFFDTPPSPRPPSL